jgi:ATP-dependent exoDNAse (exonuclease V) beta subunit
MKRISLLAVFLAALGSAAAFGQDEKQDDIKRLTTDVESLIAANAATQKKISELSDALRHARDEAKGLDKSSSIASINDDLKRLADKIQEVDKKRQADKELILEQLDKIEKFLKSSGGSGRGKNVSVPDSTNSAPTKDPSKVPDKGFEYVVQKNDMLSTIVKEYNAEFKKKGMKTITTQQVVDANPGLNPSKLRYGQKIFIPLPPP